jgi:hypothetical protein
MAVAAGPPLGEAEHNRMGSMANLSAAASWTEIQVVNATVVA